MSKAKVTCIESQRGSRKDQQPRSTWAARYVKRRCCVLLIDLDGQANLTESLGPAELPQTIYGAMKGEYDLSRSTSIRTVL